MLGNSLSQKEVPQFITAQLLVAKIKIEDFEFLREDSPQINWVFAFHDHELMLAWYQTPGLPDWVTMSENGIKAIKLLDHLYNKNLA